MRDDRKTCLGCLEFEGEIRVLELRLLAVGQYVTYSPGPDSNPSVDQELRRWLATSPSADAKSGFRAGWTRLARFVGPKLQDWESRWLRAMARLKTERYPVLHAAEVTTDRRRLAI
jgi:hypothetical protein